MTWSWKWSIAATGATALAGWLASPPPHTAEAQSRRDVAAASSQPSADAAAVSEIEEQARRLSARLAPVTPSGAPSRNPFQFGARPVPRRAPVPEPVEPERPSDDIPQPFPLRLTGVAVDVVDGAETRTAIISWPGGVELAKAGDAAAPGYRVIAVGETFAEVERVSDNARERLMLAPR
jgi:hypothetical protein